MQCFSYEDLSGKLLFATEMIEHSILAHAVILICSNDEHGTMGIVLNKAIEYATINGISYNEAGIDIQRICFGGPFATNRGFVLHTLDVKLPSTHIIKNNLGLTINTDILTMIQNKKAPLNYLLSIGCMIWQDNQLFDELKNNLWSVAEYNQELVFGTDFHNKWQAIQNNSSVTTNIVYQDV